MTGQSLMIDTNVYAELMHNSFETGEILGSAIAIFIPVIVEAELKFGFKNGRRERQNLQEWSEFLKTSKAQIVNITSTTAEVYSFVATELKRNGTPIPTNDIWISAIALEHGIALFTFDHHFKKVPGLRTIMIKQ